MHLSMARAPYCELLKVQLRTASDRASALHEQRRGWPSPFWQQRVKRQMDRERRLAATHMWRG